MFLDENFIQLELVDREARKQTRFEDHRRLVREFKSTGTVFSWFVFSEFNFSGRKVLETEQREENRIFTKFGFKTHTTLNIVN
jgi:hypothetical protein